MRRWTTGLLALLVALSFSATAFAQGGGASSTGTIQGRVTDAQGAVLPGVTVTATSPALIQPQTTVTSETGNYRFPAVPPGDFELSYELAGFNTLKRSGISITLGFTANVNVELALATLQETVTVSGQSPVIDTSTTRVQQNFKMEQLQSIPNGRDMWALLAVTPSVQMGRIDVGGNRAGTQTGYQAYGMSGQVRVLIEGINTTEGTGGAGFYFDYASLEEAFLGTSGQSAEMPNPGVQSQFIARSGSNQFQGEYHLDWYNNSLQGSNIPDEYTAPTAFNNSPIRAHSNEIDRYYDHDINIGGPIVKDKAWMFGTYREQFNAVAQPQFTFDQTFNTKLWNPVVKGTYQINQKNKLIGYFQWGQKEQPNRLPFAAYTYTDPSQTFAQDSGSWVYKGEWNGTVSDKLYLEARYGDFGYYFPLIANSDADFSWRDTGRSVVEGANQIWQLDRDRKQYNLAATYFLDTGAGSHTFKMGAELLKERAWEGYLQQYGGNIDHIYNNGVSNQVAFTFPTATDAGKLSAHTALTSKSALDVFGVFINDTWSFGRATVNAGLRYDRYHGWLPEQEQLAGSLAEWAPRFPSLASAVTAKTFPESHIYTWNQVAPRIGLTFDLTGDGKTVLKGNYGLYWHNPGVGTGSNGNANTPAKNATYNWNDVNGDRRWQPGEETSEVSRSLEGTLTVDPNIKAPYSHEAAGWLERQLTDTMGVRAGFVYKTEDDLIATMQPDRPFVGLHRSLFLHRHRRGRPGRYGRRSHVDVLRHAERRRALEPPGGDERRLVVALQDGRNVVEQALRQSLVGFDGLRSHLVDGFPEQRHDQHRTATQPEQPWCGRPHPVELQGHGELRRGVGHPHLTGAAPSVGRELRAPADDLGSRGAGPDRNVEFHPGHDCVCRRGECEPPGQHLGVRHPRREEPELHGSHPPARVFRSVQHHQQPRLRDHYPVDGVELPEAGEHPRPDHGPGRFPLHLLDDRPRLLWGSR